MTTPTQGPQQPYGEQPYLQQPYLQQPYPQQAQAYAQQPYPAYAGAPGAYGAAPLARPGMVTAASILAFIWGGLAILFALISLLVGGAASSIGSACSATAGLDNQGACAAVGSAGGFLIFIGIAMIVVAALLIWGGVVAMSGKSGQILVIAGGVMVVVAIISMIAGGSAFSAILSIVVPALIVIFMLNPASKAWIKAKGGKTF